MKKIFCTLLICLAWIAQAEASAPKTALTKAEQKLVLEEIDNICADSWCEGDYGYNFDSFSCGAAVDGTTCELEFEMIRIHYVSEDKGATAKATQKFSVSCELGPYQTKSDIIASKDGFQFADKFFDDLNLCISKLERYLDGKK